MRDYYYILGVLDTASESEIKLAYRKLSLKFHPDKNNGDKYFEERFKAISEAYEILSNITKRNDYDLKLKEFRSFTSNEYDFKYSEDIYKRKYDDEFRRREEELKRQYQEEYNKFIRTVRGKKSLSIFRRNNIIGITLILVVLIGAFLKYYLIQQDKLLDCELRFENALSVETAINDSLKALIVSLEAMNYSTTNDDIAVEDSNNFEKGKFLDAIAELESERNEPSNIATLYFSTSSGETKRLGFNLNDEQIKTSYFEEGLRDVDVKFLRLAIDDYLMDSNDLNQRIEQQALDEMQAFGKECFEGKFFLITIENVKYGGKWIQFVFLNRPNKVLFAWIKQIRGVIAFGDANWDESDIKALQQDLQTFNPSYGF